MEVISYYLSYRRSFIFMLMYVVSSDGANQFGQYDLKELLYGRECIFQIRLSPEDDWNFGGQIVYDPDHVLGCGSFQLDLITEYELDYKILFHIDDGEVRNDTDVRNDTVIDAYDAADDFNGSGICKTCRTDAFSYTTKGSNMSLFFLNSTSSCTITFTLYREAYLCKSFEYTCGNQRCIFHSMNCNGNNPCGDRSDCQMSYAAMATIALGGFCAVGVVFMLIYILFKSRKTSIWNSRGQQPRSFSPAKALQSIQSFTPATVTMIPVHRRWSYKY